MIDSPWISGSDAVDVHMGLLDGLLERKGGNTAQFSEYSLFLCKRRMLPAPHDSPSKFATFHASS